MNTRVLVIGGGPAGSTAARFLSENGIETILIEKNPSFRKPCGGGLPSTAFDELDIPKDVIKKRVQNIKIISPSGDIVGIKLGTGFIGIVERGQFDSALREKAKQAGAEVVEGEFHGLLDAGNRISAEVTISGSRQNITSEYLIASDGVNSKVKKALSLKPMPAFTSLSMRKPINSIEEGVIDPTCEFWFGSSYSDRAYSWVFPQANGISVGTAALNPRVLKASWERLLKRKGLCASDGTMRGYRIPLWKDGLYNIGKILFAGDCAGHVMPFTFEGIYYAMKAGQFAAEAVIKGRENGYKKLWRRRFLKRFSLMKMLWGYFMRDDERMERLVSIFKNPDTREAAMNLWFDKHAGDKSLLSFARMFRKFINWP